MHSVRMRWKNLWIHDPRDQRLVDGLTRPWARNIGVAAGVGLAYYLVAYVTILGLLLQPERVWCSGLAPAFPRAL